MAFTPMTKPTTPGKSSRGKFLIESLLKVFASTPTAWEGMTDRLTTENTVRAKAQLFGYLFYGRVR